MFKGFKDFLMRGNVIDLAVAVVVGSAFTALVTAFTSNIIEPFIAATGGGEVTGLAIQLQQGNPRSVIDFASVINAVITFLITAGVVYFLFVAPMQKLQAMRKTGSEETEPTDVELLQEIRDLLRQQQGLGEAGSTTDATSVTVEAETTDRVGNGAQN